jgi:hypothetical protein
VAKRVSLKGKGADIFFGDYAPPAPAPAPEAPEAEPVDSAVTPSPDEQVALPTEPESKRVRKQERMLASKNESKQARTRNDQWGGASAPVIREEGSTTQVTDDVWAHVEMPATVTNSFRYTDRELSVLADVLYEISKQQGAKLTKQDVARLGLNVVIDDYQRRGQDSMLGQLAARRRRQRRPGG